MLFVQNKITQLCLLNNNANTRIKTQSTLLPTECRIFDPFCTFRPPLLESVVVWYNILIKLRSWKFKLLDILWSLTLKYDLLIRVSFSSNIRQESNVVYDKFNVLNASGNVTRVNQFVEKLLPFLVNLQNLHLRYLTGFSIHFWYAFSTYFDKISIWDIWLGSRYTSWSNQAI